MKIAVIGAGIMGSTIGSFLDDGGVTDLWLVDPFKAHVDAINEKGLDIIGIDAKTRDRFEKNYRIKAVYTPDQIGEKMDYVIYCVKMMYLDGAIKQAACLSDENTIHVSLLNGIGSEEKLLEYYDADHIAYGVVGAGGKILAPGRVDRDFDPDRSMIAIGLSSKQEPTVLQPLKDVLDKTDCIFYIHKDIAPHVWAKMVNNCTGNAICSVARLSLGTLFNDEIGCALCEQIEEEIIAVAKAEGVEMKKTPTFMGKMPKDYGHVPSTGQDVLAKRPTEIDTINGAVSRLGKLHGIPTPYNDCMTSLVKLIQANYDRMVGVV